MNVRRMWVLAWVLVGLAAQSARAQDASDASTARGKDRREVRGASTPDDASVDAVKEFSGTEGAQVVEREGEQVQDDASETGFYGPYGFLRPRMNRAYWAGAGWGGGYYGGGWGGYYYGGYYPAVVRPYAYAPYVGCYPAYQPGYYFYSGCYAGGVPYLGW